MTARPAPHTAALVIVGNEILSGKIRDENGAYLLRALRELGVDMRRVEIIPDEEAQIVDAVLRARREAEHVFTSGGIGTTHDDVTVPAIARALGKKVVHDPEIVELLQRHWGERLDPFRIRLAEKPEGAQLLWGPGKSLRFPAILAENVLILPGVPQLFVEKFEAVKERYRATPIALTSLYLAVGEVHIAGLLTEATARFAGIAIGSYPRFDSEADYRVKVTVESRDPALVSACARFLREALAEHLLRED